jgi:hypothetical protein
MQDIRSSKDNCNSKFRQHADIAFCLTNFKLLSRNDVDFLLAVRRYSKGLSRKQREKLDRLVAKVQLRLMTLAFEGRRWRT